MTSTTCVECRKPADATAMTKGRCPGCDQSFQRRQAAYNRRAAALGAADRSSDRPISQPVPVKVTSPVILTTETALDLPIRERLGIVSAECVLGMNIFRDFAAMVRDAVGGRAVSSQNAFKEARNTALGEIKREAAQLGANAVIAIDIDYSEISGGQKSMLLVAATGTAVILGEASASRLAGGAPDAKGGISEIGRPS
jgi:uncharacterized protein YbjQ (UPF0145 family)